MNEFLARLNPTERRILIGVFLLLFGVVNVFWIWPHFSDWTNTQVAMEKARSSLGTYTAASNQIPRLQKDIEILQGAQDVPTDDQAFQFARIINQTAAQCGLDFMGAPRQTQRTNDPFYLEQVQTINVSGEERELVDFLYSLGAGTNSLIRVRELSVQPDNLQARSKLTARITLVASYQRKQPLRPAAATAAKPATTPASKPAATKPAATPPATKPAPAPLPPGKPPVVPATKPGSKPQPVPQKNQ